MSLLQRQETKCGEIKKNKVSEDDDYNAILKNNDGCVKVIDTIPEYVKKESVVFDYNDGVNKIVMEVESGEKVDKPENPIRDGYEFSGWFIDKQFTTEYDFNNIVNDSFTLYCKWTANIDADSDLNWDILVNTSSNKDYLSLSSNAYSGASMFPLEKNTKVDYIDFVINNFINSGFYKLKIFHHTMVL